LTIFKKNWKEVCLKFVQEYMDVTLYAMQDVLGEENKHDALFHVGQS